MLQCIPSALFPGSQEMQVPHVLDLKLAKVAGRQLLAANDPLAHGDRHLAEMFNGLLEGETPAERNALELQTQANRRDPLCTGAY